MLLKWKLISISGLVAGSLIVARANAQDIETVVFFDDFESADPIGTFLPDSPPIGEDWRLYVSNSTDASISANPESESRNSSSLVLHVTRPEPPTPGVSPPNMIAPISGAHQDLIEAQQNARIEFKYYDDDIYGLSLIANQAPVGTVPTGQAATGIGMNSGIVFNSGAPPNNLGYTQFDWHDVQVDIDFATETYTLTLDGVMDSVVTPFTNSGAGVVTLTSVWLSCWSRPGSFFVDDLRVSTTGPPPPNAREWDADGFGVWADLNNWSPKFVPDGDEHIAVFGSVITSPSTVAVDTAVTVNGIEFDNTNSYAIAGTGGITLAGAAPSVTVASGSHQLQVAVNLDGDTSVDATGGSLDFNNQIDLAGNMLSTTGAVNINHSVVDSSGSGAVVNSGTLGTAGSTSIEGTVTSTGTLDIDISGAGTGHSDRFDVIGAANLEGIVDVDVLGGFSPTNDITILTTTAGINLTGSLTLAGPDAGLFSGVSVVGNNLVLAVGGGGLAGDYNGDNIVNAADYVVWRKSGGTTDGYNLWRDHFGSTGGSGAGGNAQAAVPEPTVMLLLFVGLASIASRTGRFRFVSTRHSKVD
jgi:hypothetical protein